MSSFLILDVDNTLLDTKELGNIIYKILSKKLFGRTISMLSHPISEEKYQEFAKYSNHEIWKYKINQILESGELLKCGKREIHNINEVNIDYLVNEAGNTAFEFLEKENIDEFVKKFISSESLEDISQYASNVGVASSTARKIQEKLLDKFEFYNVIDKDLGTFAEEGNDKETLIHETTGKYFDKFNKTPDVIIYIGDSENDMKAIKNLNKSFRNKFNYKGIGVETGSSSMRELYDNGDSLVVSNLKDIENLK